MPAVYVTINNAAIHKTKEMIPGFVNVDYSASGQPVGVEVLRGAVERPIGHAAATLEFMTREQRRSVFLEFTEGYCFNCGAEDADCVCTIDEDS